MKAVDYAVSFITTCNNSIEDHNLVIQATSDLLKGLIMEVEDIRKMRNACKDSAILAIIREQDTKYKSVVKKVNESIGCSVLQKNGFSSFIAAHINLTL